MKFCARCGAQLAPETRFCMQCGAPVEAAAASAGTGSSAGDQREAPTATSAGPAEAAAAPRPQAPSALTAPWASHGASPLGGTEARQPRKPIPKAPLIALAALLAVGGGAGIAYSMRPAPSASLDASLLSLQGKAPDQAPQQKWSLKSEDVVRAAGIDTSSYATSGVSVLSYGTNGLILMTVPNEAVVAVKEATGQVAWQVKGSFNACQPLVNKGGWACLYSPPRDSSEDTSEPEQQLVTMDSNGRIAKQRAIKDGEGLYQEKTGTLWLASGLVKGDDDGASSSGSDTASLALTRLGDDGKPAWTYEHNVSMAANSGVVSGQAAAPLFTLDGITYVRGAQDSNGKGIALDSSGKQTDEAESAVLGNDRGRPITMKDGRFRDGEGKMKKETSALASPMLADTGLLPLYEVSGGKVHKLNDEGTDEDWSAGAGEAYPAAFCGSSTVLTTLDNKAWFLDKDGKEKSSRTLDGQPQFCWGGQQLVSLDSTNGAIVSNKVADGSEAWKLDLPKDEYGGSTPPTALVYSPTSDGFVTSGGNALTYFGP